MASLDGAFLAITSETIPHWLLSPCRHVAPALARTFTTTILASLDTVALQTLPLSEQGMLGFSLPAKEIQNTIADNRCSPMGTHPCANSLTVLALNVAVFRLVLLPPHTQACLLIAASHAFMHT